MTTTSGPDRWADLGAALIRRRIALDSRYHNRGAFCEATGLTYRLVYDIEEHRRTNFGTSTVAAIEQAYHLEPGAVRRFLDGSPELAAPPPDGTLAAPAFGWTPAGAGFISPEEQDEIAPLATMILTAVIRAQDAGLDPAEASGYDLFADDAPRALAWDVAWQRDRWEVAVWTAAKGILQWERDSSARRADRQGSAGA